MKFFIRHKFITIILIIFSGYVYLNYTKPVAINSYIDKTNINYTNDLYMSDARIYSNFLNVSEKKMYLTLFDNIKKRETEIIIDYNKSNCLTKDACYSMFLNAHDALLSDHPELLSYATFSSNSEAGKTIIRLEYAIPISVLELIGIERIERIIDEIKIATKDMSDKEKIKYVYTWIGLNNKYDTYFTYASKNQSAYNVFMHHNAVCSGFAKASQIIFQNIGIESYAVIGYSTGHHMWNIVKLDGKYYNYDSTVPTGRTVDDENFYLGLQSEFMETYKLTYPKWYPPVETAAMGIDYKITK